MLISEVAFINANVITLSRKHNQAEAIGIQNGRIVLVGSNAEISKHISAETRIVDAKGKTIVPGLVDCHVHMTSFGYSLQQIDLRDTNSIKAAKKKIQDYCKQNPEKPWILGGRWNQENFSEKRHLTRTDLDEAEENKPVFLTRVCGHIGVANTKALQLAGINAKTTVQGGTIEKDESGAPNGILRENALELIWKILPEPTEEQFRQVFMLACNKAIQAGLTCVHWMVTSQREIRTIQRINAEGKLPLRVCLGISIEHAEELIHLGILSGFGNDKLKIGFVKILADGSLGGRTAALKKPYFDEPITKGMMLYTQKTLNKLVSRSNDSGLQIAIHAIGDRAVENVLKAYEESLKQRPTKDHRHRIEHCSVLNPKLIRDIKKLGLIVSIQPLFAVSDFWAHDRLGKERMRYVFPFKSLMKQGLMVISGSDCPVESISPMLGIWAAVTNKINPAETLTVTEALKTYTINAAYASSDEHKRGTIEKGKLADLTILSDNPFTIAKEAIRKIKVEMTVIDGEIVYSRRQSDR
jgi:predicted amidohydrolase YtcJ